MSRRWSVALVAAALLAVGACDRSPGTAAPSAALVPILFEATAPSGHTAYLLGTMHAGVDPAELPAWVRSRYDAAPAFAMETDPGEAMGLAALMLRTDGKTLEDELGPAYWAKLKAKIGKDEAARLRPLKTSAAAAALEARGLPSTETMDLALHDGAFNAGKHMAYLEKPEVQLRALDIVLDARALRQMLDDPDSGEADNQRLLAAYRAGDTAALERLYAAGQAKSRAAGLTDVEIAAQHGVMLTDRNRAWVPVIEAEVAQRDIFIAVGALHLCGDAGVPALLAAAGFKVRRVTGP